MHAFIKLTALSFFLLAQNAFSQNTDAQPVSAATMSEPSLTAPVLSSNVNVETATIIFFRQKKFTGGAISFKVREGEKVYGKLKSGTYFILKTNPGEHDFTVHSEAKDVLTIKAEAGQTYYVEAEIEMGVLVGRPTINISNQMAFEGKKKSMKEFILSNGKTEKEDDGK